MSRTVTHTYQQGTDTIKEPLTFTVSRQHGIFVPHDELNDIQTLAVIRDGHLGDLLMLTPTLRQLATDYPHLSITLFCDSKYIPVVENLTYFTVNSIEYLYPWNFDRIVDLRLFVERHPKAFEITRVKLFAAAFGLTLDSGIPEYRITSDENEIAKEWLTSEGIIDAPCLIGLAPSATDWRRALPTEYVTQIIDGMVDKGPVVLFHYGPEFHFLKGVKGLHLADHPPIRTIAAILQHMNGIITVDSGLLHLTAAVQKQKKPFIVAVMGHIEGRMRLETYRNYVVIEPKGLECFPCDNKRNDNCTGQCITYHSPQTIIDIARKVIR
jgi:ADP-heptose:LPS heptosyltransferase